MRKAKDYKETARKALKGRWTKAGLIGILACLLGADMQGAFVLRVSLENIQKGKNMRTMQMYLATLPEDTGNLVLTVSMFLGSLFLVILIAQLVIGGAATLGYAKYNLNLIDGHKARCNDIVSQFHRLGTAFHLYILRALYIFLWSLLLIVPGIIAAYRYAMAPYILCENPGMGAGEAVKNSKAMMEGKKWKLFCLEISFFGWYLLVALVCAVMVLPFSVPFIMADDYGGAVFGVLILMAGGLLCIFIGELGSKIWLDPYIQASRAVFYRELSRSADGMLLEADESEENEKTDVELLVHMLDEEANECAYESNSGYFETSD